MEKPRPSPNFGKFTSTRAAPASRSATDAGSSAGSSRMTSPASGDGGFATTRRSLISVAIDSSLEGLDADAMHHLDEPLGLAVAVLDIRLDQLLDHVGDFGARERRAEHLAKARARARAVGVPLVAADFDLVPLLAVLIDAEDADVADVMVAAGVHAAGNVEVDLADVVLVVEVVEPLLQRLRHRDRLGVGERAEVAARAGDDVGDQPDVRRGEAERARLLPERLEVGLAHVGQDQVLLVRDAQ